MGESIMWVGILIGLGGLGVLCWFSTPGSDSTVHRGRRVGGLVAYLLGVGTVVVVEGAADPSSYGAEVVSGLILLGVASVATMTYVAWGDPA